MERIVGFEIFSQGRVITEPYKIGINEDAETTGKKLVKWFNLTGGNRDGSFRRFVKVSYDKTHASEYDYDKDPVTTADGYEFSYQGITSISINLREIELNGDEFEGGQQSE